MALDATKKLWTVDEVLQMVEKGILPPDNRLELIRGELIEMSPIGNRHAVVVDRLLFYLNQILRGKVIIRCQGPVMADKFSIPEPDIAILRFRENFYEDKYPGPGDILWVIEVSDTSLGYDRKIKAPLYAEMGIPEYWIADLNRNCVEVYQKPADGRYTAKKIYRPGEKLVLPGEGEGLEIREVLGQTK